MGTRAQPQNPHALRTAIPTRDDGRQMWFNNFARTIADDPARFELTAGDAAKLTQHADAFEEAMHLVHSPAHKTSLRIQRKNEIRARALEVFRDYANQIKANPRIAASDKIALGFKPARAPRTSRSR